MDLYKDKYLGVINILVNTAKDWYRWKFRTGFLKLFIEILRISMKVPDVPFIKISFIIIALVWIQLKDYNNAIFSCTKLINLSEEK